MHQYSCFISKPQRFANAQYVQTTSNFFHKRVLTIFRPPLCGGRGIGCPLFISNTNANMLHKHQGTTLFVCVCVCVCEFISGVGRCILMLVIAAVVEVLVAFACIWKLKLLTIVIFFALLLLLSLCCQHCYRGCCGSSRPLSYFHPAFPIAFPQAALLLLPHATNRILIAMHSTESCSLLNWKHFPCRESRLAAAKK